MKPDYLKQTPILDFEHPEIQALVRTRQWKQLSEADRIHAIYDYVRNEIRFGYNASDEIPASQVLKDGYGQCNTKGTLFMALLRAVGIPCRFHGFTIYKALQRGAIPVWIYNLAAPPEIIHSWVEVQFQGRWLNMEGFILDDPYLHRLQAAFSDCTTFCGYGAAVTDLQNPPVVWTGGDTYI